MEFVNEAEFGHEQCNVVGTLFEYTIHKCKRENTQTNEYRHISTQNDRNNFVCARILLD